MSEDLVADPLPTAVAPASCTGVPSGAEGDRQPVAAGRFADREAAGALLAEVITTAWLADKYGVFTDASAHVLVVGTV